MSLGSTENISSSVLTAKGDILGHNGTSSVRIPVGSNGLALTSNSGQTSGALWTTAPAGGTAYYKPISLTTISANTTTVTISSIPSGYKSIGVIALATNTAAERDIHIQFNSSTTSYAYTSAYSYWNGGISQTQSQGSTDSKIQIDMGVSQDSQGITGMIHIIIPEYDSTTNNKYVLFKSGGGQGTVTGATWNGWGYWSGTDAITSISFFCPSGTFAANSRFYVYGLS